VRRSRAHQVGNLGMRLHPRRESRDEGRLPPLHEPSRGLVSLIEVSRDAVAEHQVGAVPRFFDLVDCFACHVAAWPDTGTEYFLDNRTTAPGAEQRVTSSTRLCQRMTVLALDHTVGRRHDGRGHCRRDTLKAEPDGAPSNCQKQVGRCVMRYAQAADGRFAPPRRPRSSLRNSYSCVSAYQLAEIGPPRIRRQDHPSAWPSGYAETLANRPRGGGLSAEKRGGQALYQTAARLMEGWQSSLVAALPPRM
jgi:hypothetical protein